MFDNITILIIPFYIILSIYINFNSLCHTKYNLSIILHLQQQSPVLMSYNYINKFKCKINI